MGEDLDARADSVREMVEIAEKAFAQTFAEPRVLKEWALRVEAVSRPWSAVSGSWRT